MEKQYGVNVNLDLDSKKVKDLDQLVTLYNKLKETKISLNRIEDKTIPIEINKQIKTVSDWIKQLSTSLNELKRNFSSLAGVNLGEGKMKLADMSLAYSETANGQQLKLDSARDVQSLVDNQVKPVKKPRKPRKKKETEELNTELTKTVKKTQEVEENLTISRQEADKMVESLRDYNEGTGYTKKNGDVLPSQVKSGTEANLRVASGYLNQDEFSGVTGVSRTVSVLDKNTSKLQTRIQYLDTQGLPVTKTYYETIEKGEATLTKVSEKNNANIKKMTEGVSLTDEQYQQLNKTMGKQDQQGVVDFLKTANTDGQELGKTLGINTEHLDTNMVRSLDSAKKSFSVTFKDMDGNVRTVNTRLDDQTKQLKVVTNSVKNVKDEAKKMESINFKFVAQLFATRQLLSMTVRWLKEAFRYAMELDKALIDMSKVLDVPMKNIRDYSREALNMADKLGAKQMEILETTTQIVKLGFDLQTASGLTEIAIRGYRVGDFDNVTQSVDYLTSSLKGFNMEVNEFNAEKILDQMNEVANNTTINMEQIGEGLQRFSAVMNQVGVSSQQAIGLLTGGFDILRDEGKVANALNTISLRMRGVSEDGEELTGLVPKLEDSFNKLGLTVIDSNGGLKDTYTIFQDLASVWDDGSLDEMSKQFILEEVAGKRNAQVASAIIQNWQEVERATNLAYNSMGSSAEEFEKYLQGTESSLNRLKNNVIELYTKAINSTLLNAIFKFGEHLFYIINFWVKFYPVIILGLLGVVLGVKSLNMAIFNLMNTTIAFLATNPLGWLVLAITIIPTVVRLIDSIPSSFERLEKSIEKTNRAIAKQQKLLNDLHSIYSNYGENGEIRIASMSQSDAKEYSEWVQQVKKDYPDLVGEQDLLNISTEKYLELLNEIAKVQKQDAVNTRANNINNILDSMEDPQKRIDYYENIAKDTYNDTIGARKTYKKAVEEKEKLIEKLRIEESYLEGLGYTVDTTTGKLEYHIKTVEEQNEALGENAILLGKIKNELDSLAKELDLLNAKSSIYIDGDERKLAILQEIVQKEKEEFNQLTEKYRIQQSIVSAMDKTSLMYESELSNLNKINIERLNALDEYQDTQRAYFNEREKQYNKQIELIEEQSDIAIKAIRDEQDARRKAREEEERSEDKSDTEERIKRLQLSIDGLQGDDSNSARQMIADLTKQLNDEEEKLSDIQFEEEMAIMDDQVETIESTTADVISQIKLQMDAEEVALGLINTSIVALDENMTKAISDYMTEISSLSTIGAEAIKDFNLDLSKYASEQPIIDGIQINITTDSDNPVEIGKEVEKVMNRIVKDYSRSGNLAMTK